MKISPKKYAESLFLSLEGKNKKEAQEIVARLLSLMSENGDLDKSDLVIDSFQKYWNKQNSLSEVEVTTAKEMDNEIRKTVKLYAKEMFKADEVELKEKIDPKILGGMIIKEGDKVFDLSIRARLYGLRERIVR